MSLANRMFMLEYGNGRVPKSLSVLGRENYTITTPNFGALVETDDGLVLLDTGISGPALADPDALTEIYGAEMHPTGPAGNPVEVALARVGFPVSDVSLAVISHLHIDHRRDPATRGGRGTYRDHENRDRVRTRTCDAGH